MYKRQEDGLSFKNVITFNLDQYYPMDKDALQSYHYFMRKYLFEHTDIDPNNYHVPDGMIPKDQVKEHCREYERKIEAAGGLDLQILGIGQNGHIGFNAVSYTHLDVYKRQPLRCSVLANMELL